MPPLRKPTREFTTNAFSYLLDQTTYCEACDVSFPLFMHRFHNCSSLARMDRALRKELEKYADSRPGRRRIREIVPKREEDKSPSPDPRRKRPVKPAPAPILGEALSPLGGKKREDAK